MFIQTGFEFISLMTCKEIPLNCGIPSSIFWVLIRISEATKSRPHRNNWGRMEKLLLTDEVRSHLAQFFKKELKTCAARLGGAARDWPARYGLSLLLLFWDLLDDRIDLFSWCDWIL